MTPRPLDHDVVRNKLDAIERTCDVRLDLARVADAVPLAVAAYRGYVTAVARALVGADDA